MSRYGKENNTSNSIITSNSYFKPELSLDSSGNIYLVSPSCKQSNMDLKRERLSNIAVKPKSTRKLKTSNKICVKKELINVKIKKEPVDHFESPSYKQANAKGRKRILENTNTPKKLKTSSNRLSFKEEPIDVKINQEPVDSPSTIQVKSKGRKRKGDSTIPKVQVKKKKSNCSNDQNAELKINNEVQDKKVKSYSSKTQVNTIKELESKGLKKLNDIKTECDIKSLNNIFQTDTRKRRQCLILSDALKLSFHLTAKIMGLFDSDATIPFVVRYRQHIIQNLTAEELRNFKHNYDYLEKVFDKAEALKKKLSALKLLDVPLSNTIDSCTNLQELDYIYEPYKVTKSSKLMKVINSGLVAPATEALNGTSIVQIDKICTSGNLKENEVLELLIYHVGETMSKDTELLKKVQDIKKTERILLTCKHKKESTSKKVIEQKKKCNRREDNYFTYYNFSQRIDRIKPYQVLAINRGEKEKHLQVTIVIEDSFRFKLSKFAFNKWFNSGKSYELRKHIFNKAIDFMFNQRVVPHLKRMIRSDLMKEGEKASLEVFASNLKYLLLTPPIHNISVCAIDPGFINGCKLAVLNAKQEILTTDILYLNNPHHFANSDCKLVQMILDYDVDLIAVGNGKGCREVESCLSKLVKNKFLKNNFKYIVVNERGVSIYSCSPDASIDYPNYSPNVISAISLAKRVIDPLCEMVKVDPKHLGVGMYQHDISEKKLESELDEVVSECVSNVGVDINNAPLRILKRLAGMTDSRAKAIIDIRDKNGPFVNREQLKDVKGIGPKTFQQCAGFIKIIPATIHILKENKKINPFDQTIIHPEDYNSAKKLLNMNNLKSVNIGSPELINKLTSFKKTQDLKITADNIEVPVETLKLILEALSKPVDYDLRSNLGKPLFRSGAKSIHDLKLNSVLSGQIENVTHFGSFVDIGIECCGLIPTSFNQGETLHLGQNVTVRIAEIDTQKMRVCLHLMKIESREDKDGA